MINYKILGIHKGADPKSKLNLGTLLKISIESFYFKEKNNVKLSEKGKNDTNKYSKKNYSNISKENKYSNDISENNNINIPFYENKKEENQNNMNMSQGNEINIKNVFSIGKYNINFFTNKNLYEADMKVQELYGISKYCLLKYIANNLNDVNMITNEEIRKIFYDLKEGVKMIDYDKTQEYIKESLSQINGKNILTYINYLKYIISYKDIMNIISLFDKKMQNQIKAFWSILFKYQQFNLVFEKEFLEMIENSYFDYSLIGITIVQHYRANNFLKNLQACDNSKIKFLLKGTQVEPISKILTSDFKYSKKAFYGMGVYFSDLIDYMSFYSEISQMGEKTNWGKILPPGKTISCVGAIIYYDKSKKKFIYDNRYFVPYINEFPTYDFLLKNYKEKMVEKNGIHIAMVEPIEGHVLKEKEIKKTRKEGRFIGTDYVITEMDQILPLYGLTLRRNEYFILWRDSNFSKENQLTKDLKKMLLSRESTFNIFFESCTEKALEIIKRKRFNKIILITNYEDDVGIRFVNIVRKILAFDIVVLFFSSNLDDLKWIQNFPNALYSNNEGFITKYIRNYNNNGLLQLKTEMEKHYKCRFNINDNCLDYPYSKNPEVYDYAQLKFEDINPNFRKVLISNNIYKKRLVMDKGQPKFIDYDGIDIENLFWYVTIINGEITLFSKGYYLYIDHNRNVVATELMKTWKYEILNNNLYIFYYQNRNFTLTLNNNNVILRNSDNYSINNQTFHLLDV